MNRYQLGFILLVILVTLALMAGAYFYLLSANSIDPTEAAQNASQCVTQIVGNCIVR